MSREKALKLSDSIRAFSQPQRGFSAYYNPYQPINSHPEVDNIIRVLADEIRNEIDNELIKKFTRWACETVPVPEFPYTNLRKLQEGIPTGELNVIMAQSNVGKSMFWRDEDANQ